MQLIFLSDIHAGPSLDGLGAKVWDWVLESISDREPSIIVLGGDLWQCARHIGRGGWVDQLGGRFPRCQIVGVPGNRDPFGCRDRESLALRRVEEVELLSSETADILLVNSNQKGRTLFAIQNYLSLKSSSQKPLLVACHHPLSLKEVETLPSIAFSALILSGHEHRHGDVSVGAWRQVTCAGLDPFKVNAGLPEYLSIRNEGSGFAVEPVTISRERLWEGSRRRVIPGIAPYGSLEMLMDLAREHRIQAVQAVSHRQSPLPTPAELDKLAAWRSENPSSILSYHLPNPDLRETLDALGGLGPHLEWCRRAGVNDCTVHLPLIDADRLFNEGGGFHQGQDATRIQEIYENLAQEVLRMGARLSIENHHNNAAHFEGGLPDRLSSRPEHIRRMLVWLRERLRSRHFGEDQVSKVGWIFDSGHARNNGAVTNEVHLSEWLVKLGDFLQAAHIHQVRSDPSERFKNHFVIQSLHEPLINHEGLLAAFAMTSGDPFPAFVEVRDPAQAVSSWKLISTVL